MPTEFLMPKLGLTMEEGTILAWLVPDGAEVRPGMAVMMIETDKVESEVQASAGGHLRQLAEVGATFRCGAVVGRFDDGNGGDAAAVPARATAGAAPVAATVSQPGVPPAAAPPGAGSAEPQADGRARVSPNARRLAAERNIDLATVRGTGPGGRITAEDIEAAASVAPAAAGPAPAPTPAPVPAGAGPAASSSRSYPATVAARQLADLLGVDLAEVAPDPADGRISREDVARYVRARLRPAAPAAPPATQQPTSVRKLTGMRGTIAKRMHASLHEMAQLTLTMDAEMGAVVADRRAREATGRAPGYTDYVVAAVARALRQHPDLNAQVTPEGIAQLPEIHVGVAVALDAGLVVPVVRNTERLDLDALAAETTRLATAARAGQLTLADLDGGTFSVSALGMFGVDTFTPVVNPPNVAILGVGRLRDDVVLVDSDVTSRRRMTLSLTWDHRALDGAPAASFCRTIVELLADPARLDTPAAP